MKNITQLNQGAFPGKPFVKPIHASALTKDGKRKEMEVVNLIKEKRDGKIKKRITNGVRLIYLLSHENNVYIL